MQISGRLTAGCIEHIAEHVGANIAKGVSRSLEEFAPYSCGLARLDILVSTEFSHDLTHSGGVIKPHDLVIEIFTAVLATSFGASLHYLMSFLQARGKALQPRL